MAHRRVRRVAVLIEADDTWGRTIVESIARYAHAARWALLISPKDQQRRLRFPAGWRGDGAIVALRDRSMARHVRLARIPAVNVSTIMPDEAWLGRVVTDDDARARLALEHFRERRLEHFVCYAPPVGRYSMLRVFAFVKAVEAEGFACSVFPDPAARRPAWQDEFRLVARWLRAQPRPLAVFAADAHPARQLAEICHWEGIGVPDEVAILAGDTDELMCNLAAPRISSVELANDEIGREACRLLARLMKGAPVPKSPVQIPPLRVVARHSTEVLAIDDADVAQALRYIRDHATEGLRVRDLLAVVPLSRRRLEQRFREVLGRTPAQEIRRFRLQHARNLLIDTDLSVSAVAAASGVSSGSQLATAFRKYLGVRPTRLREGRRNAGD
jgi:LacI family transcriptional regulator